MSANLDKIVDVEVQVSNPAYISSSFNLGLIIGKSKAITEQKVKVYHSDTYDTQMVSDGFTTESTEYKAAKAYFSQNPRTASVAIGVIDTTGGETPSKAFEAIRKKNMDFYSFCFCDDVTDDEIVNVAKAVEATNIPTQFYFATKDAKCLQLDQTNVLKTLMDSNYTRTFGFYTNDANCVPSVVGLVSGLNTLEVNSAYTVSYKSLVGVIPENLNNDQIAALSSYNGNVYAVFGNTYNFIYRGVSSNGFHVDEVYMIDVSTFLIQQRTIVGLISRKKIPQTEEGVKLISSFISNACDKLAEIGLITGGIWKGDPVLNLNTGDAISGGYYIQSGTVADQSQEDRKKRISPPIYVALLSSGALEHIVVRVFVNR